jgi:hypothetical protein
LTGSANRYRAFQRLVCFFVPAVGLQSAACRPTREHKLWNEMVTRHFIRSLAAQYLLQSTDSAVTDIVGASNIRQHLTGFTTSDGFLTLMSGELGLTS